MLGPAASLQATIDRSVADRWALRGRTLVARHALVAAALLAVLLGLALSSGLTGERSSLLPAERSDLSAQKGLSSLPLTAQGPISRALGADRPAYWVSATSGGFRASSPPQRLDTRFSTSGVLVHSGKVQVGLRLSAVGYGASLQAVGAVTPTAKSNLVTYARAGVSEWYSNGPLGLEQGFTISGRPSGHPGGPLTLSMALSGNARPALADGGQGVKLSRAGQPALSYSGMVATDARGHALHSWFQLRGGQVRLGQVRLQVDTRDARYPLRIDPFIQQGSKFTGGGTINGAEFGWSVALSSDGNTALIGGPFDNSDTGAAWVFTRSGSTWTQQAKLVGGEAGQFSEFGQSVALSSDGNTALVGAPGDRTVLEREGEVTEKSKIIKGLPSTTGIFAGMLVSGPGLKTGRGGFVVRVIGEHEVELSGAAEGSGSATVKEKLTFTAFTGAAWVFTRSGSTWTQQGPKLVGGEAVAFSDFGQSVALSSDGNTALIGGPLANSDTGAAWVFTRLGSTWTQQAKLVSGAAAQFSEFGQSVALSADGNTALVGAPSDRTVLEREGEVTEKSKIIKGLTSTTGIVAGMFVSGPKLTEFESSVVRVLGEHEVELSEAAEGSGSATVKGKLTFTAFTGAAWVFTRSGSIWTQQGPKLVSGEASQFSEFGQSVALSSDGNTALVGGPNDRTVLEREGEVTEESQIIKGLPSTAGIFAGMLVSGPGLPEFEISVVRVIGEHEVELSGPAEGFGSATVKEKLTFTAFTGAAWVFTRSGSIWTQQGPKLVGGEAVESSNFGQSVTLSSDGNTALIGGPFDNSDTGAAWVFTRLGSTWTQQGPKLLGGEASARSQFGQSVALSSDGNTALIGGPGDCGSGPPVFLRGPNGGVHPVFRGAAWVFGNATLAPAPTLTGSEPNSCPPAGTTLTVNPATGDFADAVTVSAVLTDSKTASPVSGEPVTFTLNGAETCTGTTNASGEASCSITSREPAGTYTLEAAFAGNSSFAASQGSTR